MVHRAIGLAIGLPIFGIIRFCIEILSAKTNRHFFIFISPTPNIEFRILCNTMQSLKVMECEFLPGDIRH